VTATQLASGSIVVAKNDRDQNIQSESRGRPRSEGHEEAILAATIQLLSEKPLRNISMKEIARKAGVLAGLDNRCPESAGLAGKTRPNHTIRIVSKLAKRTAVWLDYRRDAKCGLSK
jgi:Bacterial regulatory proteins, tetR family